jgi:hypothetical protein
MSINGKGVFILIFVLLFAELIFFNFSLVSSYFSPLSFTGFVSSNAEISLFISQSQAIIVIANNFDGETTNFSILGNLALETLEEMTLENPSYGKIVFDEEVNLTQDAYSPTGSMYDRTVDIDSNLIISSNYLSVNSFALTSLNKSATITLYGLGYDSPEILRNGHICPADICTLISYSGGIAVFTVSYFQHSSITNYSLEEEGVTPEEYCGDSSCNNGETCSTCPGDCGVCLYCGDGICNNAETCSTCPGDCGACTGGGGGGGGGDEPEPPRPPTPNATGDNLRITPSLITADIEKGKSYSQQVNVSNLGNSDVTVSVSPSPTISNFVIVGEKSFVLKKGESKIYNFNIYSSARAKANLYTGKLIFTANNIKKYLDLAISVQELSALFDMKITSTREYVLPGKIASGEIRLFNIGDSNAVNAVLEYGVMDFENLIYASRTENITVSRNVLTKKVSLKLPDDIKIGRYILYSKIIYEDKIAVSTDTFQVEYITLIMLVILILMIIILIMLIVFWIVLIKTRNRRMRLVVPLKYEEKTREIIKPYRKEERKLEHGNFEFILLIPSEKVEDIYNRVSFATKETAVLSNI